MLTFLVLLKWVLLIAGISFLIGTIYLFSVGEEGDCSVCFIFTVICTVGFFILGPAIENKKEAIQHKKQMIAQEKAREKEKEKQIEHITTKNTKDVHLEDFFCKIDEPKYFIIATMSYDMTSFKERITSTSEKRIDSFLNADSNEISVLMDEAILKFQNYIDDMVGVSFIDRSRIAQIEKEHEFQLSDWSNEKKTAEIGNALNANILLFLENFSYLKNNGGEYRFTANLVDINSMQKTSHSIAYTGKKLTPSHEALDRINLDNFTKISSIENPFEDEMELSITKALKVSQSKIVKQNISPLRSTKKVTLSKTDNDCPKSLLLNYTSFSIDGVDSGTLTKENTVKNVTYKFTPCKQDIKKIDNQFYTDGKIGDFSIKVDNTFERYDVFTLDNYEFYFKFGSSESKIGTSELNNIVTNYYFQIIKD